MKIIIKYTCYIPLQSYSTSFDKASYYEARDTFNGYKPSGPTKWGNSDCCLSRYQRIKSESAIWIIVFSQRIISQKEFYREVFGSEK
jgi:hypothetical protein